MKKLKEKRSKVKTIDVSGFTNGNEVMFDSGKRIRGLLKEHVATVAGKSSVLSKRAQHGLRARSLPKFGMNPIGEVNELKGTEDPHEEIVEHELPEGIEVYPFCEYGMAKDGHAFVSKYYLLPPPRTLKAEIISFCKGLEPEFVETILRKIGQYAGLGDRHSQGSFGLFKVNKFELKESEVIA